MAEVSTYGIATLEAKLFASLASTVRAGKSTLFPTTETECDIIIKTQEQRSCNSLSELVRRYKVFQDTEMYGYNWQMTAKYTKSFQYQTLRNGARKHHSRCDVIYWSSQVFSAKLLRFSAGYPWKLQNSASRYIGTVSRAYCVCAYVGKYFYDTYKP